jgi:AcrR family transcriptional regulator
VSGPAPAPPVEVARSARAKEVVAAARRLLEDEGPEALTMRRLAERLGIKAPSLYKHLPDKTALEAAIIATGLEEAAAAFEAAVADATSGGAAAGGGGVDGEGAGGAGADRAADGRTADRGGAAVAALAAAYRAFALGHPHLYRLMHDGPLPRRLLPAGVEERAAAPVLRVAGDQARARALWAFAHGMVMLELDQRFPPDADLDAAWRAGVAAFQPA